MLVLTRRPGEVIHIHTSDGVITVRLTECDNYKARLGFEAPSSVTILRKEIDSFARGAEKNGAGAGHPKPPAPKPLSSSARDSGSA